MWLRGEYVSSREATQMPDRTVETILAEWRAAEAALEAASDPEIVALVDRLRAEHTAAIEAREHDADELGRPPGSRLIAEP
jgi:hypothetical protein